MIRVLLVDDHQIFRDGILSLFKNVGDMRIVGHASDGKEALEKTKLLYPNIVLLDISIPEVSGLDLIDLLKEKKSGLKILVLSMHTQKEYIMRAIQKGVMGYLAKEDTTKEELMNAIREVMANKEYFSESVKNVMKDHFLSEAKKSGVTANETAKHNNKLVETTPSILSKRETEVLKLVVEGLSNKVIADKLAVNIRTVETHKSNILNKLKLKNSVDLVKYAIQNNLLEL